MAEYLTAAWFDDVNAATTGVAGPVPEVTVQQVVTGGPGGDVHYWVRVGPGGVRVGLGRAERPAATVAQSYATAVAVARGDTAVEAAFLAGRIDVRGDATALAPHREAVAAAVAALAAVRSGTTYR